MKKVLIVSSVSRQFYLFEQGNIDVFNSLGYRVDCAANYSDYNKRLETLNINKISFMIQRSPFNLKNILAYCQLKKLINNGEYDIIHCHSPIGGVLTRFAARKARKKGTKVLYTAHGFHFFKGAPLINWMVYFPIEWICSFFADVLITINQEDYDFAKKHMHAKEIKYVPGIGIDTKTFGENISKRELIRQKLGISQEEIALLSVGELNNNKNHEIVIRALAQMEEKNIVYVICGIGKNEEYLKDLAKKLNVKLILTGYRNDLKEIYKSLDVYIFPSKREGLSVALIEAMASGLPVICSDIRGNKDLIQDGKGGFLFDVEDITKMAEEIEILVKNNKLREEMGKYNKENVSVYDKENVKEIMKEIYLKILDKNLAVKITED